MSNSENENIEPNPEETGESSNATPQKAPGGKLPPVTSIPPVFSKGPAPKSTGGDPRMSRLAKMQSQYVTEEAIRSTEESAKPKEPEPPTEGEYYDEEEYFDDEDYDGEYDDEEFDDEDFEDDDYDEEPHPGDPAPPRAETPPAPEAEAPEPAEDESDHRVARLRKLNKQFVSEKDLEIKEGSNDPPESFKEVEIAKVICPNCQSEEIRTQKICSNCGAKLPNITAIEEEKYNPGTMNAAVMKYVNAVKSLKDESWSIHEFEEFLFERERLSHEHIDGIIELVEECGSEEWMPDATKSLKEAVEVLKNGIDSMISKVETIGEQQPILEEEYDNELTEYETMLEEDEDFDEEPPIPPLSLEERIRAVNFQPDLDEIKRSNNLLLKTLKLIDRFQKKANEDLGVSM